MLPERYNLIEQTQNNFYFNLTKLFFLFSFFKNKIFLFQIDSALFKSVGLKSFSRKGRPQYFWLERGKILLFMTDHLFDGTRQHINS